MQIHRVLFGFLHILTCECKLFQELKLCNVDPEKRYKHKVRALQAAWKKLVLHTQQSLPLNNIDIPLRKI